MSDDVANVLVGPDFVAIGLLRPEQWEELLDELATAITSTPTLAQEISD